MSKQSNADTKFNTNMRPKSENISHNNNSIDNNYSPVKPTMHNNRDSCLSLTSQINHVPYKVTPKVNENKSQVRFSIPDPDLLDVNDSIISISNSPQKIVFPKEPIQNTHNDDEPSSIYSERIEPSASLYDDRNKLLRNQMNFVDMQSKIMVDVSEDIWKFHNQHNKPRKSTHTRNIKSMNDISNPYSIPNKSLDLTDHGKKFVPSHNRSRSLQSIIAETVKAYNTSNNFMDHETPSLSFNETTTSAVSPLNLQPLSFLKSKRHDLYLTSESPLNKYKVSIPLEIKLPPYLSPQNKNKNKKRASLIYDGKGYTPFNENETDSTLESNIESQIRSESLIDDDSLPLATNNISLDLTNKTSEDTDIFLGIDRDANVNLKLQNRNILTKDPSKKYISPQRNKNNDQTKDKISLERKQRQHELKLQQPQQPQQPQISNNSLKILSTPSKSIMIPNLDEKQFQTPKKSHSNGSLEFFDQFEPLSYNQSNDVNSNQIQKTGQLDLSFTFPNNPEYLHIARDINISSTDPELDFLRVASTPTDSAFETRRQRLIQQNHSAKNTPSLKLGHAHRRTKSNHNIDFNSDGHVDISNTDFNATSTPPNPTTKNIDVPKRSPFRLHSPSLVTSPVIAISPPVDKTQDSSIMIISERIVLPPQVREQQEKPKPLSSIQSFSKPIAQNDLLNMHVNESISISKDFIDSKSMAIFKHNSLSPKRQLFNRGSQQSSSVTSYTNSQFSKNSSNTLNTDINEIREIENFECIKKSNLRTPEIVTPNDNFQVIKEMKDGNEVDVIVLDDSIDLSINKKNNRDKSNKKRTGKPDYSNLLEMCDETAAQAKDIIYRLVSGSKVIASRTVDLNPAEDNEIGVDEQRKRYLQKINRTMKVRSMAK